MRFQVLFVLFLLSLVRCESCAGAQSPVSVTEHLPADASLVVYSGDIGATCAEFQETRLGAVLTGEAFRPLVNRLRNEHLGGPLNLQPIFGFDWRELQAVHQGAALLVFPLQDGTAARACVLAGQASQDPAAPLSVATAFFNSRGYARTESHRGEITLTTFTPPSSRKADSSRVLFSGPTFYGVADSLAAVEVVLAVKPADSLSAGDLWQNAARQSATAPRLGDLKVLLRPFELWEQTRHANPPAENPSETYPDAPDSLASARQVGFDSIQAVVGHVTFSAAAGEDWQIDVHVIANQPSKKAMRLLELRVGNLPEIPDFVRSDVTSASVWRWDFPLAMQGFGSMFDEANEPGPDGVGLFEDMLDGLRDDPEGVRVDLRREVFANLGPEIWSVTDRAGPKSKDQPHGDRVLYRTTVREQAKVADALKRFYSGDERVAYQRAEEFDLWTVPAGASLFVEGESDSVISVRALALGEGQLLFSTDPEQLREALNGAASMPLKDDPAWQSLWGAIREGQSGLWSLAKLDETMAPEYAAATQAELAEDASATASLWRILLFGALDKQAQPPVDVAPVFDKVRPGLSRTATRVTSVDGGLEVTITGQRAEDSP